MKKYSLFIFTLLLAVSFSSCDVLDKEPVSSYSDATVWKNIDLAGMYLAYCYSQSGDPINESRFTTGFTDEAGWSRGQSSPYQLNGTLSPDLNLSGGGQMAQMYRWNLCYANIQRLNKFIKKAPDIVDGYPDSEKENIQKRIDVMLGEALFLRAYHYHNLVRTYGGVYISRDPHELGIDYTGVTRSSYEECVDFIVEDCDAAYRLLPMKADAEAGRANKEACLALKSRILLHKASDLLAGDVSGLVSERGIGFDDPLVHVQNADRTQLWKEARDAAKALMELPGTTVALTDFGATGTGLAANVKEIADNYRRLFECTTSDDNSEFIFTRMYSQIEGVRHTTNLVQGPNGFNGMYSRNPPLQKFVDLYQMQDGTDFYDHFDTVKVNDDYLGNITAFVNKKAVTGFDDANIYHGREARFYADILYDSAEFDIEERPASLLSIDPLGIYDRRTRVTITDNDTIVRYGLDTRNSPMVAGNGNYIGYISLKFQQRGILGSAMERNTNQFPIFRFTEVVLNYAEACCELGEYDECRKWVNVIRNRVGLPNTTAADGQELLDALRHERALELYSENSRWFDIRRWMIYTERLSIPNSGIDIYQFTDKRVDPPTVREVWFLSPGQADNIIKDYFIWMPIETAERQKAPNLVQNPGYQTE